MFYLLQDHTPLKVLTHGSKLKKLLVVQMQDEVMAIVVKSRLLPWVNYTLTMFDIPLLFAVIIY